MSTDHEDSDDAEWGLTDEDRRRMGEWTRDDGGATRLHRQGKKAAKVQYGVSEGVDLALEHCPDEFHAAKLFVAAWLFEHGASTAIEVMDATGFSPGTVYPALNAMVDAGLAHTDHLREFSGNGKPTAVYVPAVDVVVPDDG